MIRIVIVASLAAVSLIAVARAPEWRLMRQLPDQQWTDHGPAFDHQVACMRALTNESFVTPSGTRLRCEKRR